jgi:hypothetical protein
MGHISIVHGYILGDGVYLPENRESFAALPEQDNRPYLTRDMFAFPSDEHTYEPQIITFGATYSGVEGHWESWLEKFEAILRTLYWSEAHVYLITEFWGAHHYIWKPTRTQEEWEAGNDGPVDRWVFSGGPRTGLRDHYA